MEQTEKGLSPASRFQQGPVKCLWEAYKLHSPSLGPGLQKPSQTISCQRLSFITVPFLFKNPAGAPAVGLNPPHPPHQQLGTCAGLGPSHPHFRL